MERNSLFLFLFMMFVWAGLCSAQTTGDKFVLIDGCFFNGMPPGVRNDEGAQMIMLTDEKGHTALEIRLNKGEKITGLCDEIPGSGRKSTRRGGAIDDLTFRDTKTDGGCRK